MEEEGYIVYFGDDAKLHCLFNICILSCYNDG